MKIRQKLAMGLAGIVGVFGLAGLSFYSKVEVFDHQVHELQELTSGSLKQGIEKLSTDFQVLVALHDVLHELNGRGQGAQPDPQRLSGYIQTFDTQVQDLVSTLQHHETPDSHDHDHATEPRTSGAQAPQEDTSDRLTTPSPIATPPPAATLELDNDGHTDGDHDHDHAEETEIPPSVAQSPPADSLPDDIAGITIAAQRFRETVQATIAAIEAGDASSVRRYTIQANQQAERLETIFIEIVSDLREDLFISLESVDSFIAVFDNSIHEFTTLFLVSGVIIIVVVVGISLWLLRSISYPLYRLNQAAQRLSKGEWGTLVPIPKTKDEVSTLAATFNQMSQHLQHVYQELSQNVSDLKASEAELIQSRQIAEDANRSKSVFLANMSHELRTPLNAIIGYSEMLQEEAEDLGESAFIPDLVKINSAGKHLLGLINDILDISKIEAGRMELFLEEFEIAPMVQEVAATIMPLIEKNQNELRVNCPDEMGIMYADVTKVRQNLFNLLSNASKFTQNGTVSLTVQTAPNNPDVIQFNVEDTGIGMTPDQITNVFEPFTQADVSTTRKYGGTGLGLTITRKFCQMMGGDITASSQEGQGSCFSIHLPRYVEDPLGKRTLSSDQDDSATIATGNGRILVIDDDPSVGEFLQRSLARYGLEVHVALSGTEGLELARSLHPSAITLDVMMPGMDGWAVLTDLKNDPELATIPVVMLTIVNDQNLGYSLGASDYLLKPINREQLLLTLHRFRVGNDGNSVLVIEDSAMNREVLRRQLEKEGWCVQEAKHGRQALDLMAIQAPNLILLDLMMPEMDGFEFLEEIRTHPEWQAIPVVVVTAKDLTIDDRARLNGYVETIYRKGNYDRQTLLGDVHRLLQDVLDPVSTNGKTDTTLPSNTESPLGTTTDPKEMTTLEMTHPDTPR